MPFFFIIIPLCVLLFILLNNKNSAKISISSFVGITALIVWLIIAFNAELTVKETTIHEIHEVDNGDHTKQFIIVDNNYIDLNKLFEVNVKLPNKVKRTKYHDTYYWLLIPVTEKYEVINAR